ncbi:MAG: acyl-CoA dehydrogenase family protein, partial [Acidobacteriota bacterium]
MSGGGFTMGPRARELGKRLRAFMDEHVYPIESEVYAHLDAAEDRWQPLPQIEPLKEKARAEGLWNLFLPHSDRVEGLSNLDYAPLCEIMGRVIFAPEIFNCSAPDTGNMEVLERYGSEAQKERWLEPLLAGEIRSCFAMTEPEVASSDATNIQTSVERDGDHYVVNGRKWWTSGAGDPRCKVSIVLCQSGDADRPRHARHSMILVPFDTPGVEIKRMLTVFGYDDAPHGHAEVLFDNVRVPAENMILGEGRGFEIAQGRLGPGRIHHCMRLIGMAERALETMCRRVGERTAFGRQLSEMGTIRADIATSRIEIEQARLLTLKAAHMMDTVGNKAARAEIAMIKIVAPNVALEVLDRAIQAHGGYGYTKEYMVEKIKRDVKITTIYEGTSEIMEMTISRDRWQQHLKTRGQHYRDAAAAM